MVLVGLIGIALAACQPQTVIVRETAVPVTPVAPADSLAATYLGKIKHVDIYRFIDQSTGDTCYLALGTQSMGLSCPARGGR
jgi:hypothetical protein